VHSLKPAEDRSSELVGGRSSTDSDRVSIEERLEVFADTFPTALMECIQRFFGAMEMA
jgi:hypothetical protein